MNQIKIKPSKKDKNIESQVYNPFLPLNEYIPDGEPHIFDGRVYIFGSHDKEGGYTFCMLDYVAYSAPVDDLTNWRYEGIIYRREQDPDFNLQPYMYAPDVVRGNDGKYYLYYSTSGEYGIGGYQGTIKVAVCDKPAGEYEYLGFVKNPDGTPMLRYVCFDPAVINDNGTIRLYYGTQYDFEEQPDFKENDAYMNSMISMFGRSREEIESYEDSIMGPVMATLCDDMLTIKEEPHHIIPAKVKGTSFEEHPFFEASSIRIIDGRYYFIYSSMQNHELCYAMSEYPDRDFTFGGVLVSNGDIGIDGRSIADKLNMTGTTHGSIICIEKQWYVFYHRLTHRSDYSRQACAEKIYIDRNGHFRQAKITSCGLNKGALKGEGIYPAAIACVITNGHMPHGCNSIYTEEFPAVVHYGKEQFIAGISDGTIIGFRSFGIRGLKQINVSIRIEDNINRYIHKGPVRTEGRREEAICIREDDDKRDSYLEVRTSFGDKNESCGIINIDKLGKDSWEWNVFSGDISIRDGVRELYFEYHGSGKIQFKEFELICAQDEETSTITEEDIGYMNSALSLAKEAKSLGEVPIGCVIVCDDRIIGQGMNLRKTNNSTLAHAEIAAIKQASEYMNDWRLEGCTMYVTLEPCQMCAGAIVQARMDRVVIGCMSPKSGSGGSIINVLQNKEFNHQVRITKGVLEKESSQLLSEFFLEMRSNL